VCTYTSPAGDIPVPRPVRTATRENQAAPVRTHQHLRPGRIHAGPRPATPPATSPLAHRAYGGDRGEFASCQPDGNPCQTRTTKATPLPDSLRPEGTLSTPESGEGCLLAGPRAQASRSPMRGLWGRPRAFPGWVIRSGRSSPSGSPMRVSRPGPPRRTVDVVTTAREGGRQVLASRAVVITGCRGRPSIFTQRWRTGAARTALHVAGTTGDGYPPLTWSPVMRSTHAQKFQRLSVARQRR
jgi:hypothetical protein